MELPVPIETVLALIRGRRSRLIRRADRNPHRALGKLLLGKGLPGWEGSGTMAMMRMNRLANLSMIA